MISGIVDDCFVVACVLLRSGACKLCLRTMDPINRYTGTDSRERFKQFEPIDCYTGTHCREHFKTWPFDWSHYRQYSDIVQYSPLIVSQQFRSVLPRSNNLWWRDVLKPSTYDGTLFWWLFFLWWNALIIYIPFPLSRLRQQRKLCCFRAPWIQVSLQETKSMPEGARERGVGLSGALENVSGVERMIFDKLNARRVTTNAPSPAEVFILVFLFKGFGSFFGVCVCGVMLFVSLCFFFMCKQCFV